MEQFIRILIELLVSKGMEITAIPAFIRNVANGIAANPSLSFEDLNDHLRSLGWGNFELDDYTFCLFIATFEPDLASKLTHCFDPAFNPYSHYRIDDDTENVPNLQVGHNKPLQE